MPQMFTGPTINQMVFPVSRVAPEIDLILHHPSQAIGTFPAFKERSSQNRLNNVLSDPQVPEFSPR